MQSNLDTQAPIENKAKCEVQKIYVKEITCKVPQAPGFFVNSDFAKGKWEPTFSLEMHVKHQIVADNRHEVVLQATAHIKTKENITAFTLEVQQAGLFLFAEMTSEQIAQFVKTQCPAVLYPYLGRAISEASVQAGFPALLMPMPNIDQMTVQAEAGATSSLGKVAGNVNKELIQPGAVPVN